MASLQLQKIKIINNLKNKLYKAGLVLEGKTKQIVAIDTGNLENNIKTFPVKNLGNVLRVEVGTDNVSYAGYVEYGVGLVYNYHRNGEVVYTGDGQHYLQRAYNDSIEEIINIVKS